MYACMPPGLPACLSVCVPSSVCVRLAVLMYAYHCLPVCMFPTDCLPLPVLVCQDVCVAACIFVCPHACTHVCMYMPASPPAWAYVCVCGHVTVCPMYMSPQPRICLCCQCCCVCMYVCVHVCLYASVCMCVCGCSCVLYMGSHVGVYV